MNIFTTKPFNEQVKTFSFYLFFHKNRNAKQQKSVELHTKKYLVKISKIDNYYQEKKKNN